MSASRPWPESAPIAEAGSPAGHGAGITDEKAEKDGKQGKGGNEERIAYLLYNERPMSGLVKSQVIPILGEVRRLRPHSRITVIAIWQPWIYFSDRDRIKAMHRELLKKGVHLENRPFAILPSRYFLYSHRTLPVLMWFVRQVFRALGLGKFDLVHARSYVAAVAAAALKARYRYKLIFDMRSLMPEEYVTIGKWAMGSPTYLKWKEYERYAVERADAHVSVSAPMKVDADRICPSKTGELIHLNADIDRLMFDGKSRDGLRSEIGWEKCFVLAYLGSLGFKAEWNNIYNYAEYFARLEPLAVSLRMVFVVPQILPGFWDVIDKAGIPRDRIKFIQGTENLRGWLSAADAGIQVMSPGPDSHTRFGVKVVEYLACGLPVIVNSNAGAAADFIERNQAGIRLDLDGGFAEKAERVLHTAYSRERLFRLAADNFSLPVVGRKYGVLYDNLLGSAEKPS